MAVPGDQTTENIELSPRHQVWGLSWLWAAPALGYDVTSRFGSLGIGVPWVLEMPGAATQPCSAPRTPVTAA